MNLIEKLRNCPNCAGILDDAGRCNYCGSKVYDFLALDFSGERNESNAKTYIRIRFKEGEFLLPILSFLDASITATPHYSIYDDMNGYELNRLVNIERRVDISCICGDLIQANGGGKK